ncbi:hypothetical protein [Hyphococcus sp.]|uniref:hypothetical protein n=1 Tax=Hyphococcus sp. TaxID=2038636 RepID=UPI003CCB775B
MAGRIRRKLASRYKCGVVFTHPQKCGGSSLEAALFRKYRFSHERIHTLDAREAVRALNNINSGVKSGALPETEALLFCQQAASYAMQRGVKCVTGHNPLTPAMREAYAPDWKFITLLREPVERFCSHLRYSYNSGMETSAGDDIDAFLETPRARWWGGLYATFFGGWLNVNEPVSPAMIDEARALILDLDAVGFLDRTPDFERALSALLGAKLSIGHVNRTSDRATAWRGEFSEAQMDKIRTLCQPSTDIYGFVREKLITGG